MMLHIGISGDIAAGKSTLAKQIKERAENDGYHAHIIAFATGIRELVALEKHPYREQAITRKLYDWGYDHDIAQNAARVIDDYMLLHPSQPGIKNRRLLQSIGTEVGREFLGQNTWIVRTQQLAKQYDALDYLITDDVRFDNEVLAVDVHIRIDSSSDMGCYMLRLQRYGADYVFNDHASERSLTLPALLTVPVCFNDTDVDKLYTTLDYVRRIRL